MRSLRELQANFSHAVRGGPDGGLTDRIVAGGIDPSRRLGVYRNNVHLSLARVLEGNFPATRRQAGEAAFGAAVHAYLRAHPPAQPQLLAWGGTFPAHLASCEATRDRPWLADLAALEWAREEVYYAADAPVLAPAALQTVPPDDYPGLRFALHPTARLLASGWPIFALWQDGDARPTAAPQRVLVIRPAMEVLTLPLTAGEHGSARQAGPGPDAGRCGRGGAIDRACARSDRGAGVPPDQRHLRLVLLTRAAGRATPAPAASKACATTVASIMIGEPMAERTRRKAL